MIELRQVGRSGLRVTSLCLGTANFGWVTDAATSLKMLTCAFEAGLTFLDTADIYNRRQNESSEMLIGRWLAEEKTRRSQIVHATKVYGAIGESPNDAGLSARHIRLACEESLRRLQTDWIDIYMLHHVDLSVRWEETLDALNRLVTQGKVVYIGTCNFAAWHLTALHFTAAERKLFGAISEQSPYSLAERRVELEVLPACRHHGIGFLAYSPLAEGFLGGPESGRRRSDGVVAKRRRLHAEKLHSWHTWCKNHGLTPAAAALSWVLAQPGVASAVIGPRTEGQLESCIEAASMRLEPATLNEMSVDWPSPGIAPQAYAW